jgi:hypothetical protein
MVRGEDEAGLFVFVKFCEKHFCLTDDGVYYADAVHVLLMAVIHQLLMSPGIQVKAKWLPWSEVCMHAQLCLVQ